MAQPATRKTPFINHIQKFEMIAMGKWFIGFDNKILNVLYRIFSFAIEWFFVLMTLLILVSIATYKDCPGRSLELLCYFVQYGNSNLSSFLSKSEDMRKCIHYLLNYENTTPGTSSIDKKFFNLNKTTVKIFIISTCYAGLTWYSLGVASTYTAEKTDDECAVKVGLVYQIWYPFDLYKKFYLVTSLSDKLLFYCVVQTHVYNKMTPVACLLFILCQIKILQKRLRTIEETVTKMVNEQNITYNEAVFKEIVKCLKIHQEIIRFMLLVESACKEIVLVGYFTNALEIATYSIFLLLQDTFVGILPILSIVLVMCIQMIMTFWFANEILIESTALADVIYYETEWIKFDKSATQLLMLMMLRAQKALMVRLPTIGHMSIDLVTKVMKLCYSTVTFVKTMYL